MLLWKAMVRGNTRKGMAFQEYSPRFPHKRLTLGFAGRPGGPAFYISTMVSHFRKLPCLFSLSSFSSFSSSSALFFSSSLFTKRNPTQHNTTQRPQTKQFMKFLLLSYRITLETTGPAAKAALWRPTVPSGA